MSELICPQGKLSQPNKMNVMHKRFVYLNMKQNNICSNIYTNNKDFLRKQTFVSKMNDAGKSMTSANRGTTGTVSNLG